MRIFTFFTVVCWLGMVLHAPYTWATHQVGGHLEMKAVGDVAGHFQVTVTNYLESGTRGIAIQASTGTVGIFRKRDNALMMTFTVQQTGAKVPIVYANAYCASQRNLNFVVWTYEADIQLSPGQYADDQGYYMAYQTRNRNAGINNISTPDQTGFTFYLEFPALQQNGAAFTNSSPQFGAINGEYVCLGEPFTYAFGGTDPDGDELRYSMITPLNQKGTGQNSVTAGPYPDISWLSGFSADNAIPGNPTLRINAQTGELSVTATQLGLFVFAVKIEEYRNGVKIGEVRRDFQFLVVDCPPQTTPEPTVQFKTNPTKQTTAICVGDSVVLQATVNSGWNYQWRLNGINIAGATGTSLTVREAGVYMVVVSQNATCSKTGNSENLTVLVVGSPTRLFENGHLCATTGTVHITAYGDSNATYQWYRNGNLLTNQTADSLSVTEAGTYWAVATDKTYGCRINSDTSTISRSAAVVASIQSTSGQNRICPNATLQLLASGGVRYSWQQDGLPVGSEASTYTTSTTGTYVVTATDSYGCTDISDPVVITQVASIVVTLDSIPGVCGTQVPNYALIGSPAGGVFAGDGVSGNVFSTQAAGIGNHTITYTVKPAPECPGVVATRIAVVAPIPTIQLPDSMATYTGNTFQLNPVYTGNPTQFLWSSATYLNDPTLAAPTVQNIEADITYTVHAQNNTGCSAQDTIRIRVFARLWIPDAFSPNNDGLNDTWELFGIEAFPNAIVTIFNRWGEVIFRSAQGYPNPFDGTLRGHTLPQGVYAYTVSTVPSRPVIRGSLMLIR